MQMAVSVPQKMIGVPATRSFIHSQKQFFDMERTLPLMIWCLFNLS